MVAKLRFHDEILGLKGFDVTIARIISRLLPAPLINFYVGVIIGLTAPAGLGPTMTPLSAILVCTSVMVILPICVRPFKEGKVSAICIGMLCVCIPHLLAEPM